MLYLLPQAIDSTADRSPEKEAIRFLGKGLTYEQLALRSGSLARVLREQGVKRGDRVGTFMNKSLEAVISLYGIMKAGATFVPLDPLAPPARLGYVIKDCGIRFLFSKHDKLAGLQQILASGADLEGVLGVRESEELPIRSISWEDMLNATPLTNPYERLTELDLSYILYTSGSTGNPKGIAHTHRNVLNIARWGKETYSVGPEDRLGNFMPFHFIPSTFDLYSSALAGATTVIIPEAITKFPSSLSQVLAEERISIFYSVPFALNQLREHGSLHLRDLSNLRWVLITGEVFHTKHLVQLMAALPDAHFSSQYGSTEAYTCAYFHVPQHLEDSDEPIPMGKILENVEDLVLDEDDQPVTPGEIGELLIRSAMLMRGYWGQPEKNENSFYRRRNSSGFEDLYYRTGDLAQLLPDGNYRYRGRKDRMVKTRGYRVELDEVEAALLSHPLVEEAAAYAISDEQGSKLIEAAVIPRSLAEVTAADILQHLNAHLPSYAVPLTIHLMSDFPRTSTGKISRRELQELAAGRAEGSTGRKSE
jgi:L-proline---[L-prolyl-carrier protein] ligase